jgi:hypothetical protein
MPTLSHNLLTIIFVEQTTFNNTDAFVYRSLVFGLHPLSTFSHLRILPPVKWRHKRQPLHYPTAIAYYAE